jgi:phosphodiesterase/alkaline phosphatase D-like protein
MNRRVLIWAVAGCASLLTSNPARAQLIPPAKKAAHVEISQGPELESAKDHEVIICWTSNNPGGSDEHFGVVHYGKNPADLSQTSKSHIRLNQGHPQTVFCVRVDGLEPHTTYYYKVDSGKPMAQATESPAP